MSGSNFYKNIAGKGGAKAVWLFYVVIVFEIIYMISPFALYYYSFYKVPLVFLQSNGFTSFLTVNLLPHFVSQKSIVIFILNFISWPLMFAGTILFLISFIQIYAAKIFKKGAVSAGLYKFIRHPQYAALAILGLGAAIYWSRFIVYIMYATMLFLYYFLAKQEERICFEKYGDSYRGYHKKTGMFFLKSIEDKLIKLPRIFPEKGLLRITVITVTYFCYIAIIIISGFAVRNYALSKINARYDENRAVVSIASFDNDRINKAVSIFDNDWEINERLSAINIDKQLLYICPLGWDIPELGIKGNTENYLSNLSNPVNHGNSDDIDKDYLLILFTKPVINKTNEKYEGILKNSLSYIPYFEAIIDLKESRVISITERKDRGKWDGIPVPIY